MPTGTAEEIFEIVSGSGEEALTRNKKLRIIIQNIHLPQIKMKLPPQNSTETKSSMLYDLIDGRSDFTQGKFVQILMQLLLISMLLITNTGKGNLIISARHRVKCHPDNMPGVEKSYLYATGMHFFSSSNNLNTGNDTVQLLAGLKKN